MKRDFKNINDSVINGGSVFYLYGNFKKSWGVFCDFLREKIIRKYGAENVTIFCATVGDALKILRGQCSLFRDSINVFCLRNIEDSHEEKLRPFLGLEENIFLLESGDYGKSRKVTDYFVKSNFHAVASFKNDQTLHSLCRMLLPTIPLSMESELVKIMGNTDEDLRSVGMKISLLMEDGDLDLLKEYTAHAATFLQQLDFIPLIRYLQNLAIKEQLCDSRKAGAGLKFPENILQLLLTAELRQKYGSDLPKSYLYNAIAAVGAAS
ncbi:MAG: hypothetical protein LBJ16_03105 [Holosporaceae bacterium]|jgi:hypothetical protein|nr:hypothetical protein [Holosporaceae bacterium]